MRATEDLQKENRQVRTIGTAMMPFRGGEVPVLLPFYSAEENALERGVRPYSVTEILREVFGQDFEKAIQFYMDNCPEGAARAVGREDASGFRLIRLSEPKAESRLHQRLCCLPVDLEFHATVEAAVPSACTEAGGTERKRFAAVFRVRYTIDMRQKKCSVPITAAVDCSLQGRASERKPGSTDGYLLPILYTEDYARAGRRMLEKYYPEALEKPTAVNGWELAKRMNLHAWLVRFEESSEIQGRIYFDEAIVRLRDVSGRLKKVKIPAKTILINRDCCATEEIINSTLVHECCHVFLHAEFFILQMLSGKACKAYTSRKRSRQKGFQHNGPVEWMELQAEKLPAYVLMEEENTRREIERLLALRGGARTPENMARVMCALAEKFRVSRSMAKYRMIELGYREAEGIYAWLGRERIPDYGCASGWKKGVTYTISLADAGALLRESPAFAAALKSGRYVYAEGHYCLDLPRYIRRDGRGVAHLTSLARHAVEECCIAFTVNGRYAEAVYEDARVARKTPVQEIYQSRHGFSAEPETKARVKENVLFTQDSQIWVKLKREIPDELGTAIQKILDEKGITQLELSMRLGCSRAALLKWCSGYMSLRHITAICIALDVRADIALELVRLAGLAFRNNREENLLLAMLYETKDLTVARANEILRQEKLPPLTEGRDEEIAC